MESIHRIAWALRKVRLPVKSDGLVLDVGAGGCPYPRADVLLERYAGGQHRHGVPAVSDRPTVFADATKMPFKDKAFDFVIASHVLEHVAEPEAFLRELMRVGKAGYIETPNLFLERLCPYPVHVLELIEGSGKLLIRKKTDAGEHEYLARIRAHHQNPRWRKLFHDVPQLFHVRYFWNNVIEYEIDNPEQIFAGTVEDDAEVPAIADTYESEGWRAWGLRALRKYYAWRGPVSINWLSILACCECRGELRAADGWYVCDDCAVKYPTKPYLNFLSPVANRGE